MKILIAYILTLVAFLVSARPSGEEDWSEEKELFEPHMHVKEPEPKKIDISISTKEKPLENRPRKEHEIREYGTKHTHVYISKDPGAPVEKKVTVEAEKKEKGFRDNRKIEAQGIYKISSVNLRPEIRGYDEH